MSNQEQRDKIIRRGAILAFVAGIAAFGDPQGQAVAATDPTDMNSLGSTINQTTVAPLTETVGPATPVARAEPPAGNPLWAVPLRSLSVPRDRPIFSPSRRPPPPVVIS